VREKKKKRGHKKRNTTGEEKREEAKASARKMDLNVLAFDGTLVPATSDLTERRGEDVNKPGEWTRRSPREGREKRGTRKIGGWTSIVRGSARPYHASVPLGNAKRERRRNQEIGKLPLGKKEKKTYKNSQLDVTVARTGF